MGKASKKAYFLVMALVSIAIFGSGCGSTVSYQKPAIQFGHTDFNVQLSRADVTVGQKTTATASRTFILFGFFTSGGNEETAYQDILSQCPNADAVIALTTKYETGGFWPFVWGQTITLSGKPVTIKTEAVGPGSR